MQSSFGNLFLNEINSCSYLSPTSARGRFQQKLHSLLHSSDLTMVNNVIGLLRDKTLDYRWGEEFWYPFMDSAYTGAEGKFQGCV